MKYISVIQFTLRFLKVIALTPILLAISFSVSQSQQPSGNLFATGLIDEDPEEFLNFSQTPTFRAFLPEKIDLSARMPPVGDQGRQGSCVGWAVGYAARSYYTKASAKLEINKRQNQVSPAYVYDAIRRGTCDDGSRISDALNLLQRGVLSFDEYVYDDNLCRKPTLDEKSTAKRFKIKGWRRVDTTKLDQIKGALAQGHPLIIAGVLDRNFHRLRRGRTWEAGPIDWDNVKSGHAFTLVGYNDRRRHFKVLNSWGNRWGTRGYANITYETFKHRIYAAYQIVPLKAPQKPHKKIKPKPVPDPSPQPTPEPVKLNLPVYECSRLKATKINGKDRVSGFVSSEADLADLKLKVTGDVTFDVDINPWPQCEALLIVENGKSSSAITGIDKKEYSSGDLLSFNLKTPQFSSHIHIAYFQADGSVVNLSQSAASNLVTHAPTSILKFGDGEEGRPAFNVQGPFGDEMVLAITTKSPLFDEKRPLVETEREFLSALRAATIELEETTGLERFYSASSVILKTKEKE